MYRIGILGGTFNPIHIGHMMLAEWAMDAANLEQVWLIPTGMSYKKAQQNILPGEERLHMTELAIQGNPRLRCLDMEIRREGETYTWETLELLRTQYPDKEFYFIAGADCLFSIENWRHPERIFRNAALIAAVRADASMEEMETKRGELLERFGGTILLLPFVRLSVTSTEIRERIRNGQSVRYMVPEKLFSYMEERGLYRCEEG